MPASEIPPFPDDLPGDRKEAALASTLEQLVFACSGESTSSKADKVDRAVGGRGVSGRQALMHLILDDNSLAIGVVSDLVRSVGRYPDGVAALAKVARFAHEIAAREYEEAQRAEAATLAQHPAPQGFKIPDPPPAERVIESYQRELLAAVVDGAALAGSSDALGLVEQLAASQLLDVGAKASVALAAWGPQP